MKAAIITIGDELLIGQTVDTNSAWMGAELSKSGFDVYRITSIHDRKEDIIYALNEAAGKADVVLITGGLGPTSDDITKQTLCEFFNTRLVINPEVFKMIEGMMNRRNFPMNENNRRQAEVPESCKVLTNAAGTAPGMWFEKKGTIYISMPGVPYEMKYIMTEHVLPELNKRFTSQIIIHRNIMTYGTFEAKLAEILTDFEATLPDNIKLAYLPASGVIKLRLTGTGTEEKSMSDLINEQVNRLYEIIPDFIYGENEESLEMVIGKMLKERHSTLCTAESCTGGEVAHMITSVAGSSAYFKGSVIAYSNSVKIQLLGVQKNLIDKDGAVSEMVVQKMAAGARKLFKTEFAVATSGIAGPDGGTEAKPVGTVWIAVASGNGIVTEKGVFGNDRITNIKRFSLAALNLLRKQIINS
ncbi:MAG: competence/damage-inducible protein A [Bacteroidetes bacterium]|nr:MAG: competence/damage-inducible protein A [Bacteroidota bacterium]